MDEVKDIRDKALALEEYARRARNTEAERQCADIRLRAEERAGELLAEMQKAMGTQGQLAGRDASGGSIVRPPEDDARTLKELGISKQQSSDWQKLAAIPKEEFEADLADPMWRPTTSGLLQRHEARGRPAVDTQRVDG